MKEVKVLLEKERSLLNLMIDENYSKEEILKQSGKVDMLVLEIVKAKLAVSGRR